MKPGVYKTVCTWSKYVFMYIDRQKKWKVITYNSLFTVYLGELQVILYFSLALLCVFLDLSHKYVLL